MLYYVQYGDTLSAIALRFNTTVGSIMNANVICNSNLIFPGQALIIPENMGTGSELPKSGGMPYYIVKPGDTLYCLARQFNTTVSVLCANNQLDNPNMIYAGAELLVIPVMPNPQVLKDNWENTARLYCNEMNPLMEHGIYFIGTYEWEALGESAVPFLLKLLKNPCAIVRRSAVISLGRISPDGNVKRALSEMYNDIKSIVELARLAVKRIDAVSTGNRRIHFNYVDSHIYNQPYLNSEKASLKKGTGVVVLEWHIPSPLGEEGPRGGVQVYDRILVIDTGITGFMPRVGYNESTLI
jgi:LysM repeat protein